MRTDVVGGWLLPQCTIGCQEFLRPGVTPFFHAPFLYDLEFVEKLRSLLRYWGDPIPASGGTGGDGPLSNSFGPLVPKSFPEVSPESGKDALN